MGSAQESDPVVHSGPLDDPGSARPMAARHGLGEDATGNLLAVEEALAGRRPRPAAGSHQILQAAHDHRQASQVHSLTVKRILPIDFEGAP